jgi:hypothetical protein
MSKWISHAKVANTDWMVLENDNGRYEHDQVMKALFMDIRNELRRLNQVLQCPNFIAVPSKLDQIAKNTRKRRRPKTVGKPKLRVVR